MNKKTFVNTKRVPSGRVVVSTVEISNPMFGSSQFETMVFEAQPDMDEVLSYIDLDAKFYDDALDAIVGHDIMIKEWSA